MKNLIEACLFATGDVITPAEFSSRMGYDLPLVQEQFAELWREYGDSPDSGFTLVKIAGGYQMVTRPELANDIGKYLSAASGRNGLSRAALETMAIVAYRQPVTQSEIEAVRGVSVDGVLKTLIDRSLVVVSGRKPVPGRPLLYSSTPEFLSYFGLDSLAELPALEMVDETDVASEAAALESIQAAVGIE
jgi:segregation and condensation protein B